MATIYENWGNVLRFLVVCVPFLFTALFIAAMIVNTIRLRRK